VGDAAGPARIDQLRGQPVAQAQALVDLPQGQHAGVAGEPFGAIFDDDRAVEIEREKRMLRFTHGVRLRVRFVSWKTPAKLHAEAAFSSATPRA
jgi:hypothetical protein